ncbi:uncharacterized protein LOC129316433 [Prosopis cineraria]|uniref:uncharacterized protein LOC129316433 n=1 Tax=Prosopis cineraria TaxID=364024 RepID=UPI0024102ED4|nr:uncharacterized protein LOC129316433 [Prosopis cineraria]
MANVVEMELNDCPQMLERLKSDARTSLYTSAREHASKLTVVLKLYQLKAEGGWSDTSFTNLLSYLHDEMLSKDNKLPRRLYDAKMMLKFVGLSYEKIHACPNDCILFRKEHESLFEFLKCLASRYKENGKSPKKVLWYFPIVSRFRRLYRSEVESRNLTWHKDGRIKDTMLRHLTDSPQWKRIDSEYPNFVKDNRNLRLELSTDRMNLFGLQSSTHSTWPVILINYSLPLWLCMKRKYLMLSLLISRLKQPENDIDMYLAPLVEDLKILWETSVEVYDGYKKESFNLRALLFGTINDFLAYGNLSGYSVKGKLGCPICKDSTHFVRLEHSMKNVYLGHRRWLPKGHYYRRLRKSFNRKPEEEVAPLILSSNELFEKVKDLDIKFGKPFAKHVGIGR